jgi:hypothetical protein
MKGIDENGRKETISMDFHGISYLQLDILDPLWNMISFLVQIYVQRTASGCSYLRFAAGVRHPSNGGW